MARPRPGKCVHCLGEFNDLTWDHVFPVSWYPDTTPENIEKWQAPACEVCNGRLGKAEDKLLSVLALCVNPFDAHASGITEKVLRSSDPSATEDAEEKEKRAAKRAALLANVVRTKEIPKGLFPGFGPEPGLDYGESYAMVKLPVATLDAVNEKIVRCLTYVLRDGAFIGSEYKIGIYYVHEGQAALVDNLLQEKAVTYYRGPGVAIQYGKSNDGEVGAMMKITLWNKYSFYCVIQHSETDATLFEG